MDASNGTTIAEPIVEASAGTHAPTTTEVSDSEKPDMMGFELALQLQDVEADGFEAAVIAAADSAGGELLFDMPLPAETNCRHVAAVAIGAGPNRLLMLVTMPNEGDLRVEAVEGSKNPVAGIVAAYAGLMPHLAAA